MAAVLHAPVGRPFDLPSFIDAKTYDRDPAVRALLQPQRFDKALLVTFERNNQAFGFMTVFHRMEQPDFEPEHARALGVLARHVARSCKFRRIIFGRNLRRAAAGLRARTDRTIEGMLVLSRKGIVIDADVDALAILETQKGLVLRGGRLFSTSTESGQDTESLHRFLSATSYTERPFVLRAQNATVITLELLPFSNGSLVTTGGDYTLVVVRRARPKTRPDITTFSSAYSLTKAETRVIAALTTSANATDAAASLGIGRETIKTHLAHIYARTEAESLPQLMMLVGRFS